MLAVLDILHRRLRSYKECSICGSRLKKDYQHIGMCECCLDSHSEKDVPGVFKYERNEEKEWENDY